MRVGDGTENAALNKSINESAVGDGAFNSAIGYRCTECAAHFYLPSTCSAHNGNPLEGNILNMHLILEQAGIVSIRQVERLRS